MFVSPLRVFLPRVSSTSRIIQCLALYILFRDTSISNKMRQGCKKHAGGTWQEACRLRLHVTSFDSGFLRSKASITRGRDSDYERPKGLRTFFIQTDELRHYHLRHYAGIEPDLGGLQCPERSINTNIYIFIYTYIYIYACAHARTHARTHTRTYTRVHARARARVCIYICIYTHRL